MDPKNVSLEFVKGKLINFEMKRLNEGLDTGRQEAFHGTANYKKSYKQQQSEPKCHGCGKIGHIKKNCWSRKANQAEVTGHNPISFVVGQIEAYVSSREDSI
ncbi:hypothetical protein WA026_016728 [Henosepilachna vigintioctopunctata]|uniref:CCHC-type domain-containing protein n=1 Tax=Henosepilachna vigintioctopunctata TaxID=420089 RepID=A0AAW1V2J1_9CUCU